MTLLEFKAWFQGFSEGVADAPTPEQWAKIKAKVEETEETPAIFNSDRVLRFLNPPKDAEPMIARLDAVGTADDTLGKIAFETVQRGVNSGKADPEDYPADHPEHADNIAATYSAAVETGKREYLQAVGNVPAPERPEAA